MTRLDDSLLTLIEPFPIDDWKIGKVFAAESQWIVNYLQNTHSQLPADFGGELNMWMTRPSDALERQMLKTRATDNLLAQIVIPLYYLFNYFHSQSLCN